MTVYQKTNEEFTIRAPYTGRQVTGTSWRNMDTAVLADGNLVTTWYRYDQDAYTWTMFGQLIDPSGSPVGSEFIIAPDNARDQFHSQITALANGNFAVTWTRTLQAGDTSATSIGLQIMQADGTPVGNSIVANTQTSGRQEEPSIATLSDGSFVVVWATEDNGWDIHFQRFAQDGSTIGSEGTANTHLSDNQTQPIVTGLSGGGFAIAWTDFTADTDGMGIKTRVFANDGTATTDEVLANTTQSQAQTMPAIAGLADGGYVVTWRDDYGDTSGTAIRAQVFAADGSAVGSEIVVNTVTYAEQTSPSVTGLSDGNFVVTWMDHSGGIGDTSGWAIIGQVFAPDGTKSGGEFLANSFTPGDQVYAAVASGADGSFAVTWFDQSRGYGVNGQWFGDSALQLPRITGTTSDDRLNGTAADERLDGLAGNDRLNGGAGNDILNGGDGNDTLTGGTGADQMNGGAGNDTFYVDDAGDTVAEASGQGTDLVYSTVSFTLGDNVENLTLTGTGVISGNGNALDNRINGNAGANVLSGGDGRDTLSGDAGNDRMRGGNGDDTLNGGTGNDVLHGDAGNDTLSGGAGDDTLHGGQGNDTLKGDAGADAMDGGAGDDTYYVDDAGDSVTEAAGEGTDWVYSSVSFTLGDDVENLTLTGLASQAFGNAMGNRIRGNAADNQLFGDDGNDTIQGDAGADFLNGGNGDDTVDGGVGDDTIGGGADNDLLTGGDGDDTLSGGSGNDTLRGDAGADVMEGNQGNDIYYVDNAGDLVNENFDEGYDLVYSSVSFALSDYVDNLTLTGNAAIDGTGNDQVNVLIGNGANNVLHGNDGNDALTGGAGDDSLHGDAGNDTLSGGVGNDLLSGGAGNDTLSGGAGADLFRFADFEAGAKDKVTDFSSAAGDRIVLDAAAFGLTEGDGLSGGALDAGWFAARSSANANHGQFLWNSASKTLFWDADGIGGNAAQAVVTLNSTMTVNDILIG